MTAALSERLYFASWVLALGVFVLGSPPAEAQQQRRAQKPAFERLLHVTLRGGASQIESLDPKPGSPNAYPQLGVRDTGGVDIYGQPVQVSELLDGLANLTARDPQVSLGIVRSMSHGSRSHGNASMFMSSFTEGVEAETASGAAVWFQRYFADRPLPAVVILGNAWPAMNDPKTSGMPPALQVAPGQQPGTNPFAGALDPFDLTGQALLPSSTAGGARSLTVAMNLLEAGVPFVSCGFGGYDSHANNLAASQRGWGVNIDEGVVTMINRLKQDGIPTLVVISTEFGRTPGTLAFKDGRDHHSAAFSVGLIAINQPRFRTTAVGDTGPDGTWEPDRIDPETGVVLVRGQLRDPIGPPSLGAFLVASMGIHPFRREGRIVGPDGQQLQAPVAREGNRWRWLMRQFGLRTQIPRVRRVRR